MGLHDFEVDMEALFTAATQCAEAVQAKVDYDVEDYLPSEDSVANDEVWQAIDEFQERWEQGVNNLVDDIEEVAGRLMGVLISYADFNVRSREKMQPVTALAAQMDTAPLRQE